MTSEEGPSGRRAAAAAPFRVLAVCTGNVCRSPAAERLLLKALGDDGTVSVASAGTRALVGHGIAAPMADLLRAEGADPSGFVARQLEPHMPARADLIIGMTREHRSAVVTLHPKALRRTFTLRELARIAQDVDPVLIDESAVGSTAGERLAALIPLAIARRGLAGRPARDDDVVDPWRRSDGVYRESMRQITSALGALTAVVRG